MLDAGSLPALPLAATIDLQGRLPPFQQSFLTPTIIISLVLLVLALLVIIYLSHRSRAKVKLEKRLDAIRLAEKILRKRGGQQEDVERVLALFKKYPEIDPASVVMVRERFDERLRPLLEREQGIGFVDKIAQLYFPPPRDVRQDISSAPEKELREMVEEVKSQAAGQAAAALLDLMDATLRPGLISRILFTDLEGGHECIIMGHDMQGFNVTLPANNPNMVAAIKPGMEAEGTLESGPSLLAYNATVIQAVAGSMPYCRLSAWKSAWEIRKRDSVRLPLSLDIDFQHISTASTGSIKMANLDKEIGTVRPGRLTDLSLGGCGIETPSTTLFSIGDMIRFSHSLTAGTPPATLLGALVKVDAIDPERNFGSCQRLHVQFLVIDDVSQRILVRTLRYLQDLVEKDEWLQAQQLLQMMRRNNIQAIGSPAPLRREGTGLGAGAAPGTTRPGSGERDRPPTRSIAKPKSRPTTRSLPRGTGQQARPATRSIPRPPTSAGRSRPSTRSVPRPQGETRPSTRSIPKPPNQGKGDSSGGAVPPPGDS